MRLEIKTADELVDPELESRWDARRADGREGVLQHILRRFIEREGPVAVEEIHRAFSDRPRDAVVRALTTLDEKDLILFRDGQVTLAYPFSADPTPFRVILPTGGLRYACCAIDALGIAAMLRQRVEIRSWCHHCKELLELATDAEGPGVDADGIMVWVGTRDERDRDRRISTSL